MNIFVTGGSGFVGSHAIKRLISAGHHVTALARSEPSALLLRSNGANVVIGDFNTTEKWSKALGRCDAVVHCAAPVELWGPWEMFERDITVATKRLLEASVRHGVKRFVHISSESVLQDRDDLIGVDETHPYPAVANSFYGQAKKLAEIELLASPADIDIAILRPPFVWGLGAPGFGEIHARAASGSFLWIDGGEKAFEMIHVMNLAEAILIAATKAHGKQIYFVTDDAGMNARTFFSAYFEAADIPIPKKSIPNKYAKAAACFFDGTWRALRLSQKPPLTNFEWSFFGMPRRYNIGKIKKAWDYNPVISHTQGFVEIASRHQ